MNIQWLGHACFLITLGDGKTIITDPFGDSVGYPQPGLKADLVTVSHQHYDHNAVDKVGGSPRVIDTEGAHSYKNISVHGIPSWHDKNEGSQRGGNIMFVIEAEGVRVCHLGDLGHTLNPDQVSRLGRMDVLLIPVGGFYTIGPDEAARVVEQLNPGYVAPMHYKTDYIDFPIVTADEFLKNYPGYRTEKELAVTRESIPDSTQAVLLELRR
ncbi:MAG: MBL fold metallo-hydrolase [Bacillota bacterium]